MAIRPDQKRYRQTAEARAKRKAYDATRRANPEAKAAERARGSQRRAAPQGKFLNKERVQKTRDELCNSYVAWLLVQNSSLRPSDLPWQLIELKRLQLKIERELRKVNDENS